MFGGGLGYGAYPQFYSYFASYEWVNPDPALLLNWKHPQVIKYRRRLLLNCPWYANINYTSGKEIMELDGLHFWDKPEEKPRHDELGEVLLTTDYTPSNDQ